MLSVLPTLSLGLAKPSCTVQYLIAWNLRSRHNYCLAFNVQTGSNAFRYLLESVSKDARTALLKERPIIGTVQGSPGLVALQMKKGTFPQETKSAAD